MTPGPDAAHCYRCNTRLDLPSGTVSRGATCDRCGADVHSCMACIHYDRSAYNECREPSADRVVDKEKRNFCDYFALRSGQHAGASTQPSKDDLRKKLDDLFKK